MKKLTEEGEDAANAITKEKQKKTKLRIKRQRRERQGGWGGILIIN